MTDETNATQNGVGAATPPAKERKAAKRKQGDDTAPTGDVIPAYTARREFTFNSVEFVAGDKFAPTEVGCTDEQLETLIGQNYISIQLVLGTRGSIGKGIVVADSPKAVHEITKHHGEATARRVSINRSGGNATE